MQRNTPKAPSTSKEDYDTTEEYEDAEKDYGQELNGYTEKCEAIRTRSEAGEISLYLRIESNDITLCYVANTATTVNGTATEMPLSPIEKLEKQDKRNKEIALEKTVEDTKSGFRGRYVRAQIWTGRGENGVFLPALLTPQRAFQ